MALERKYIGVGDRTLVVNLGELLLPAIVLLFSAYYYFDTYTLPERSTTYAFPILYITVAFALIVVVTHGVGFAQEPDDEPRGEQSAADAAAEPEEDEPEESSNLYFNRRSAVGLVILSFAYYILFPYMGFLAATSGFLAATLYIFGERNWLYLAAYSAGFTLLVWAVFIRWLQIPLPTLL